MTDSTIKTILFKTETDDILNLAQLVITEANEHHFFSPKLNKGELFEAFEQWALSYQLLHDLTYDVTQTEANMNQFFTVKNRVDAELVNTVQETMSLLVQSGAPHSNSEIATIMTCSAEDPNALILEVPWVESAQATDFMQSLSDEPDTLIEHGEELDAKEVFHALFADVQAHAQQEPYLYQKVMSRLVALDADKSNDVKQTFKALEAVVDILLFESDNRQELNAFDIVDFIYNLDYSSLARTNTYLTESIDQLESRMIDTLPYYEGAALLQQHFLENRRAVPANTVASSVSPLLFLYADIIEEFALAHEEEDA